MHWNLVLHFEHNMLGEEKHFPFHLRFKTMLILWWQKDGIKEQAKLVWPEATLGQHQHWPYTMEDGTISQQVLDSLVRFDLPWIQDTVYPSEGRLHILKSSPLPCQRFARSPNQPEFFSKTPCLTTTFHAGCSRESLWLYPLCVSIRGFQQRWHNSQRCRNQAPSFQFGVEEQKKVSSCCHTLRRIFPVESPGVDWWEKAQEGRGEIRR